MAKLNCIEKELPPLPALKNPRHERFVQQLVKGQPASTAYRLAGYKAHDGHGNRLRHKPAIARRYDELVAAAAQQTEVTAARLITELAAIAFANVTDYVRIDGNGVPQVDLGPITRAQAAAVTEVIFDERKDGAARVRFKLADKRAALVDLAKILGLFRERADVPEPPDEPLGDYEAARRIAFILTKASMQLPDTVREQAERDGNMLELFASLPPRDS